MRTPFPIPPEHPRDEEIARGRFVRLLRRDGWEFMDHPGLRGIVAMVAITPASELLLVEQYRVAVDTRMIELPAGIVGDKSGLESESFESAAARELEEETGWRATRFHFLGSGPASPGRTRFFYHFYAGQNLSHVSAGGGDETEDIVVHAVPLAGLDAWLMERERQGMAIDLKIFAGLQLHQRWTAGLR